MDSKVYLSKKNTLLIINCIVLALGNCGGPLVLRLYFLHGGNRLWLSAFLQTVGFPFIFIILVIAYFHRWANATAPGSTKPQLIYMNPRVFFAAVFIGLITGADNYLYASGIGRLPVSTACIIISSQLVFTAGFAFLLVKQKFTSFSINAVVLLTIGAVVLSLHSGSDKPKGESQGQYISGFVMTLGAAALLGFFLPFSELTYIKAKQSVTYTLVLEIQLIVCFVASIFTCVGMIINNDFKVIPREAREFGLGEAKYYLVLVSNAILWQCFFIGVLGVASSSSLLSGILIAALIPVTEVLAVIFYQEKFQAEKGIALALSIWGFISYFYGEMQLHKKNKKKLHKNNPELELPPPVINV